MLRRGDGRFGGYVGNYIGDGILAYFGYPRAHEDDAQRAVRAGLGMVEAIAPERRARDRLSMAIRIGINTGLVVVGDIGTGESRDEMAVVGETPNVAARLQGLAEPGTVVVGDRTYRLIEGLFLFDELGALLVKGCDAPVPAYRVREPTGASALRGDRHPRPDAAGRARGRDPRAAVALAATPRRAKATWCC